jgi:DNA-binding NarL/FixJ family response regulator
MPTSTNIVASIDERIEELEAQLEALGTARAVLAEDVVAKIEKSDDDVKATRLANLKKAREAKAAKDADKKGAKKTRGQQILDLLETGLSVREVAETLDISKGYVYNTKNRAAEAAA